MARTTRPAAMVNGGIVSTATLIKVNVPAQIAARRKRRATARRVIGDDMGMPRNKGRRPLRPKATMMAGIAGIGERNLAPAPQAVARSSVGAPSGRANRAASQPSMARLRAGPQ